jgi:hypothetical protein
MSKSMRWIAYAASAVVLLIGAANAAQQRRAAGVMRDAASRFLVMLTDEQRARAAIAFDDEERFNWFYTPVARRGLTFKEMTPDQEHLAHALMASALSARGYLKAETIMSLEPVLREIESRGRAGAASRRDPETYYFSIFGDPAGEAPWGWRVEGHHVSLNVTVTRGGVVADSPAFFGANPHRIVDGARAGLRALGEEEDLGRELARSMTDEQRAAAILEERVPRDIITTNSRRAEIEGEPRGLTAAAMDDRQRETLRGLIDLYVDNAGAELAAQRRAKVEASWPANVRFVWIGSIEPGQAHYYRVQGEKFLIEYDNSQGNANHSHTVWRDFEGDWGLDLLALHYASDPHR